MDELYCPYCDSDQGKWEEPWDVADQTEPYNFKCSKCGKRYWANWEPAIEVFIETDERHRKYLERHNMPYELPNEWEDD